jgi:hypothetical protein
MPNIPQKTLISEQDTKLISQITKLVFVKTDAGHMYRQNFQRTTKSCIKKSVQKDNLIHLFSLYAFTALQTSCSPSSPHTPPPYWAPEHTDTQQGPVCPPPPPHPPPSSYFRQRRDGKIYRGGGGLFTVLMMRPRWGFFLNRI